MIQCVLRNDNPVERVLCTARIRHRRFDIATTLHFQDPLTVCEIAPVIHNIEFRTPGEYRLQVFAADAFIGERRLFVVPIENPEN